MMKGFKFKVAVLFCLYLVLSVGIGTRAENLFQPQGFVGIDNIWINISLLIPGINVADIRVNIEEKIKRSIDEITFAEETSKADCLLCIEVLKDSVIVEALRPVKPARDRGNYEFLATIYKYTGIISKDATPLDVLTIALDDFISKLATWQKPWNTMVH